MGHSLRGVLPLCREAVGVLYNPSQLGQQDTRCGGVCREAVCVLYSPSWLGHTLRYDRLVRIVSFILSIRSDFHMTNSLSIAVHTCRCHSRLMRHCFLGRSTSQPVSESCRLVRKFRLVSILLYGCTTWTLTKRMEKKLEGNYTRMLRVILNKSGRQYPTKQQLGGNLPPITKTILCTPFTWPSKSRATSANPTYSGSFRIRDVALTTCQKRWTIGRRCKRGSEISVLVAQDDDDYY